MDRLPPELIESIIDALVGGIDQDPWIADRYPAILVSSPQSIRSCRPRLCASMPDLQTCIFFAITVGGYACIPPPRISVLLTVSPHLASYIRALYFGSVAEINESMAASVAHILSSVTNLERLVLNPSVYGHLPPGPIREAFRPAFTLSNMRQLSLVAFQCEDLHELQECLGGCKSLESLMMYDVRFDKTGVDVAERTKNLAVSGRPCVVLDTVFVALRAFREGAGADDNRCIHRRRHQESPPPVPLRHLDRCLASDECIHDPVPRNPVLLEGRRRPQCCTCDCDCEYLRSAGGQASDNDCS
ncbi:hypothetical protein C8R47DRAFT_756537 [Mycena vitilis]|nr:hypothetical protein C8R47DRAFT_756537 [Mycena vitilis]